MSYGVHRAREHQPNRNKKIPRGNIWLEVQLYPDAHWRVSDIPEPQRNDDRDTPSSEGGDSRKHKLCSCRESRGCREERSKEGRPDHSPPDRYPRYGQLLLVQDPVRTSNGLLAGREGTLVDFEKTLFGTEGLFEQAARLLS